MPAKPDLYAALLREYYQLEQSVLAEASAGLAATPNPEAGRTVFELAISQLRAFIIKALQSQALRLSDIEEALRLTGESLRAAQQRMEGMERENAEASALLFKMKVRGESQPHAAEAQELADKVIEQERLLQKREGELSSLRKQFQDSQTERKGLLLRLEEEEGRVAAPEPVAPPPDIAAEELGRRLQEAQAALREQKIVQERQTERLSELEASRDDLARRLRESELLGQQREAEAAALSERLATHERSPRPADERPTLRARLAELERRLAEPGTEVAALRRQLQNEEAFRGGFIQRIQALEAARYRAQEDAKIAVKKLAAAERVPWAQERAGFLGKLETMEKELHRLRAVNENSQREWTDTLARQEALRLAEINDLKRELEKHRLR